MKTIRMDQRALGIALCAAFVILTPNALAANRVKVGDEMPDFSLTDYTGKIHRLSDYRGKQVVIEFCSHGCPWSRGTDSDIAKLAAKYGEKGVVFLGIDADREHTPEDVAEHAEEAGIPFPIVKDTDNLYADEVGAARTPEIYIVDPEGMVVYHGAFDDRVAPTEAGENQYVAKALDELLAGEKVSTPKVSAWGCTIKRVANRGA